MENLPNTELEQPRIKWGWLSLSMTCLLAGFLYLIVVDIAGPVQLTQTATEQQP